MKTRIAQIIAGALVLAACGGTDGTSDNGIPRISTVDATTTSVPSTTTDGIVGSVPTPDPVDAGVPEVIVPLEVEPCEAPTEELEAYCQPFELELGNTTIVWDRWFWGQGTFSKGSVEVYHGDTLVAAGPFIGTDSIVVQDDENRFIFYDTEGEVVAIAAPDDITPAIQAALDGLSDS
ncbi:MAG: hypothetical protein OER12_03180 [Acidimicrobiia bacterium]|nr:hypothetical protein [Acidimicrobiia bacterium]